MHLQYKSKNSNVRTKKESVNWRFIEKLEMKIIERNVNKETAIFYYASYNTIWC